MVNKCLTECLGWCNISKGQIGKNIAVLLQWPNIGPDFLISNDANISLYGENCYPGTCSKCLDHISQKIFSDWGLPKFCIRNHSALVLFTLGSIMERPFSCMQEKGKAACGLLVNEVETVYMFSIESGI